MNDTSTEKIEAAAIRVNRSEILTGVRHGNIMQRIWEKYPNLHISQSMQGFTTSTGRFVTRNEAGKIAFEAGQTKELKESLLSEDVW